MSQIASLTAGIDHNEFTVKKPSLARLHCDRLKYVAQKGIRARRGPMTLRKVAD